MNQEETMAAVKAIIKGKGLSLLKRLKIILRKILQRLGRVNHQKMMQLPTNLLEASVKIRSKGINLGKATNSHTEYKSHKALIQVPEDIPLAKT